VKQYVTASAIRSPTKVIGKVSQDILNAAEHAWRDPSGDVIADAQLVATQPANWAAPRSPS
jgi:hypothetical protein